MRCPECGHELSASIHDLNKQITETPCPGSCGNEIRVVALKFFPGLLKEIKERRKRKTFRYEDEKDIAPGDILALYETRPHHDVKPLHGYATVTDVEERPIEEFTEYHFAWHTGSDGPEQLANSMRSIYREPIALQTTVKYIAFDYHE